MKHTILQKQAGKISHVGLLLLLWLCASALYARPMLIGHRGSIWGVESSATAFISGAQAGFAGLETDVKVTSDGKFVLVHDDNLSRFGQSESVTIAGSTLAQLKAIQLRQTRYGVTYTDTICTLEEYLDICNTYNVFPVIELKWATGINSNDQSNLPALLQLVAEKGLQDKAVILTSMKPCLEFIRNHAVYGNMKLQFLCYPATAATSVEWCVANRLDVDIQTGFTKDVVDSYHAAGLQVNCWTLNTPAAYATHELMGVDMVTTDSLKPSELLPEEIVFSEALWSKTQAGAEYILTGSRQRSMDICNGRLYIPDNENATIAVVSAADGSLIKTLTTNIDGWKANCVSFTADGVMLLGSSNHTDSVFYIHSCDTASGVCTLLAELDITGLGVADYFDTYGNLLSASGGYIVSAGSTGKVAVFRMSSGQITFDRLLNGSGVPDVLSMQAVVNDDSSFFLVGKNLPRQLHYLDGVTECQSFSNVAPAVVTASAVCFSLAGHSFFVSGEAVSGIAQLFDITDGLSAAVAVGNSTTSFGRVSNTVSVTTPMCIELYAQKAVLYIMATNGGIAAYEYTFKYATNVHTATIYTDFVRVQQGVLGVKASAGEAIAVYDVMGHLHAYRMAQDEWTYFTSLPSAQVYIVKSADKVTKVLL